MSRTSQLITDVFPDLEQGKLGHEALEEERVPCQSSYAIRTEMTAHFCLYNEEEFVGFGLLHLQFKSAFYTGVFAIMASLDGCTERNHRKYILPANHKVSEVERFDGECDNLSRVKLRSHWDLSPKWL